MKKNLKLKVLVFIMLLTMVVVMFPSVTATPIHNNKITAPGGRENAQFIFSLNASKTSLKPGEEFTVTLTADKIPPYGMSALGFEMDYDNRQIEVLKEKDRFGRDVPKMELGPVGESMSLSSLLETVDEDDSTLNRVKTGNGIGAVTAFEKVENNPNAFLGEVLTVHFRVKENASGKLRIYMAEGANGTKSNGFKPSGVKVEGTTISSDLDMTYWLDTNLDSLFVDIPAIGVTYTGPETINLNTQSTMSIVEYVKPNPSNTSDTISWKTSNENVVTVSNGILTAVGQGSATITATVGGHSVKIPVKVVVAEFLKGDMDKNGIINGTDASIALDKYNKTNATEEDILIGDMDGDGKINGTDASMILDIYNKVL